MTPTRPRGARKEVTISERKSPAVAEYPRVGSFLLRKEERYARNYLDRRLSFGTVGCNTGLASQPRLGLLPERGDRRDPGDSGHPAALGSALGGQARQMSHAEDCCKRS